MIKNNRKKRQQIDEQVKAFLSKGGEIKTVKKGESAVYLKVNKKTGDVVSYSVKTKKPITRSSKNKNRFLHWEGKGYE